MNTLFGFLILGGIMAALSITLKGFEKIDYDRKHPHHPSLH